MNGPLRVLGRSSPVRPAARRRRCGGSASPSAPAIARRGDDGDGTPLGSLRSPPITVVADDGVPLHVEVDELPRRRRRAVTGPRAAEATARPLTVVFVHGYALNLDCWHFQRAALPRPGPHRLLRPALPRPLGALLAAGTPRSTSSAATSPQVLDAVVARGSGGPGRPLDGRHDRGRPGRAAPRAVRRPGRRGGADLHHRRRARPQPDPAAAGPGQARAAASPTARCARWPAGTGPSTACAASVAVGGHGGHRPVRVRRRRAARRTSSSSTRCSRPRRSRWSREFFPSFRGLDKFDAVEVLARGADRDHLRHRGPAHLDRSQPQAARPDRRLDARSSARAPGTW